MVEKYDYEVGKGGSQGLDLLDLSFNPTTMSFIKNFGLKAGMKVLDVGCGTGVMSRWLAQQVGELGKVIAIDNSENQLEAAKEASKDPKFKNIEYKLLSVYDILDLKEKFDLIYCRFVLHHVHSPRKAIKLFYEALNPGGIYVGEEGIISAAFAYPPSFAWAGYEPKLHPAKERDGEDRDGDFGMKIYFYSKLAGFEIIACQLVQPVLWEKERKSLLLQGLKEFKKTALEQGMTEEQWKKKYEETERLIADDNQIMAFYQSCQVAGKK
jgi:SAM-dependent methyltransferase